MIAAAIAQQVSPALASQPRDVGEGFAQMWATLDRWGNDFLALVPNLVVSVVVALLFLLIAWAVRAVLHKTVSRGGGTTSRTCWRVSPIGR